MQRHITSRETYAVPDHICLCVHLQVGSLATQHGGHTPAAGAAAHSRQLAQQSAEPTSPYATTGGAAAVQPPLTVEPNSTEAATSSVQAQNADTSGTLLAPLGVLHNETTQLASDSTASRNGSTGNVVASDLSDYANLTSALPAVAGNNATRTNFENAVPLASCQPGQIAIASQCVTLNETVRGSMGMSQSTMLAGGANSPSGGSNSAFAVKADRAVSPLHWAMPWMSVALALAAAPVHVMR